jgi:hypothetical protein
MGTKISSLTTDSIAEGDVVPVKRGSGNVGAVVPAGGYAAKGAAQTFSGGQRSNSTAVTSSGNSTAFDFSANNDFTAALTENTTFANPSNLVAGQKGRIAITQGATARTVAFGSYWKFEGGTAPSVSTGSGAIDILCYDVISSTQIVASLVKGFA